MNVGGFEEEWQSMTKRYPHGSFKYDGSSSIRMTIASGFRNVQSPKYGVYVIRQEATRQVLYVGKGGTIGNAGAFKGQDIPGRLANVKGHNVPADNWFRDLAEEQGPLTIEYLLLASKPESPALVESRLLQAHLNEHRCLPHRNKEL